ncbi:MAG: hypothetical protein JWN60_264 [Acidobacteria bacterium]|jgi:signal-transduction protein with cAMP-binding, CBS, and nucleotidyltransferase domain|nr:hypothetical protein [Acidobacteriota bacterium]
MFVRDLINENSVICTEHMPLTKVYQLMQENGCDCITVVESYAHPIPIGIITEHDMCLHVVGKGRDPHALTAANVMNTNIIKAPYMLSVTDFSDLMKNKQAKRALIVNEDGMFCGTLANVDLENKNDKPQTETPLSSEVYKAYDASRVNRIY